MATNCSSMCAHPVDKGCEVFEDFESQVGIVEAKFSQERNLGVGRKKINKYYINNNMREIT